MHHSGIVNYHRHSPERQAYRIDADGISGRLASPEHVPTQVQVRDVRGLNEGPRFASESFTFLQAPYSGPLQGRDWAPAYEAALEALLREALGAQTVHIFDHTLRVDDPAALRRPARNVHSDYSAQGARARLDDLLGPEEAAEWAAGHYAFVNVWRPVEEIRSAPLGFVRPCSVPAEDWLTLDLIYPDRLGQIMGLVGNPAHQWVYRSRMTPDEVAVFNIHDNRGRPPVAHSAIDLVDPRSPKTIRKSLESRTLLRFAS